MKKILLLTGLQLNATVVQSQYVPQTQIISTQPIETNANLTGWSWFNQTIVTPSTFVLSALNLVLCFMIICGLANKDEKGKYFPDTSNKK